MKSFGMSSFRRAVSLLVMFTLLAMAGFSYAVVEKANVAKKATTTSAQGASESSEIVVIDDISLAVDQDYVDAVMNSAGIKAFDPNNAEHKKARAVCMAVDKAWAKYHEYRANSDFENAEKYALNSLVRGWCAWNLACSRIGNFQDGHWSYDSGADEASVAQALKDLDRATNYASLCRDKKSGKNNVNQLLERIASTTDYLKSLSK